MLVFTASTVLVATPAGADRETPFVPAASVSTGMATVSNQKAVVERKERAAQTTVDEALAPEIEAREKAETAARAAEAEAAQAEADALVAERDLAELRVTADAQAATLEQTESVADTPAVAPVNVSGGADTIVLPAGVVSGDIPETNAGGALCTLPDGQSLPTEGPWPDTLHPVHVAQVAQAAGFTGPDLTFAVAVAYAESSHRPSLTNQNTDKHRSVDYGLFQINGYYHPEQMAMGDWQNPWTNARMAHSIWSQSGANGRWSSWVAWKKGRHEKHMGVARAAVAQLAELEAATGTCG